MNVPTIELPADVQEAIDRLTAAIRDFEVPDDVQEAVDRLTAAIRNIEVPDVKLPTIEWSSFDMPKIDMPKVDMPDFKLPEFDMPKIDIPDVELPSTDQMVDFARDAAYVGVGVAVVTAQKADERLREMSDAVTDGMRRVVDAVA